MAFYPPAVLTDLTKSNEFVKSVIILYRAVQMPFESKAARGFALS